jgi:hypothetical protein
MFDPSRCKENPMRFLRQSAALLMVTLVAGAASPVPAAPAATSRGHAHPTAGPHHGTLIELGREDYHAELVHDEKADTITIYILDAAATKAVPIAAAPLTLNVRAGGTVQQFPLTAKPQSTDPEGTSSAFTTADKRVGEALHTKGATGHLNVEIAGKRYVGRVGGHTHAH